MLFIDEIISYADCWAAGCTRSHGFKTYIYGFGYTTIIVITVSYSIWCGIFLNYFSSAMKCVRAILLTVEIRDSSHNENSVKINREFYYLRIFFSSLPLSPSRFRIFFFFTSSVLDIIEHTKRR